MRAGEIVGVRLTDGSGTAVAATVVAVTIGVTVTGLILATPYLTFGFRSPSVHLVLNSVDACIGLLAAFLVHARFLRNNRLQDLLLSQGLAMLVVAGFGLSFLTGFSAETGPGTLEVWLPVSIRLLGSLLIAGAAVSGARQVRLRRWHRWPVLPPACAIAVVGLALWSREERLPVALDLGDLPRTAEHPILTGHPLLIGAQAVAMLCFFIAAAAFTRQAALSNDELLRWLGPACVLGGFARLNYLLFPSLYTDWLYTGDLLRTGCYLLLLVGSAREIQQYWTAQAEVAVLDDRRRLARELHDGVIQELNYIKAETRELAPGGERGHRIIGACERALDEARAAVQALGTAGEQRFSAMLELAARQIAMRYDVTLRLELDHGVEVSVDQQHALVRITREAISNAVRHGSARVIEVRLNTDGGERHLLSIRDDGHGFDVADVEARVRSDGCGYGLTSMRDRARGLPGVLHVESSPGQGSVVTVQW